MLYSISAMNHESSIAITTSFRILFFLSALSQQSIVGIVFNQQDYFLGHTMLYYSDILGFSLLSIPFLRSIPSLKSFSGLCIFLKMTSPLLRSVPCLLSKPPLRSTPLLRSHCVLLFGTWFVYENSRLSIPNRLPPLSISTILISAMLISRSFYSIVVF